MFASTDLAARIERSGCTLLRATAAFLPGAVATDVGNGVALMAGAGSPFTKVYGLGFSLETSKELAALDALEREWDALGVEVTVELSTLARAGLAGELTDRGYRLRGFEDVLGIDLSRPLPSIPNLADTSLEASGDDAVGEYIDVALEAALARDVEGVALHYAVDREDLRASMTRLAPRNFRYLARRAGAPAAAASMAIFKDVAWFTGMGTLPAHRRRGLQTALIAFRLADARRRGAELATLTALPGSRSKQNAERNLLSHLYSRAVLVRGARSS